MKVDFLGSYGTSKVRVGLWFDRRDSVLVSVLSNGNAGVVQAFKRLVLREAHVQKLDLLQVQAILSSHSASLEVLTAKPTQGQAERVVPQRSSGLGWLVDALASVEAELSKLKEEREQWRGVPDIADAHVRLDALKDEVGYLSDKLVDDTRRVKLTYRSDFGPSPQQALDRTRLREYRSTAKREESDLRQRMDFTYRNRIAELEDKKRQLIDHIDRERERESEGRALVEKVIEENVAVSVVVTTRSPPFFTTNGGATMASAVREVVAEAAALRSKLKDRLGLRFEDADEVVALAPLFLTSPVFLKKLREREGTELAESLEQAFALVPKDAQEKALAKAVTGLLQELPELPTPPDLARFPSPGAEERRLAYLGRALDSHGHPVDLPVLYDLDEQGPRHTSVTGGSGSGKSVAARVLVEGALLHGLPVLVFDPTRSWKGFGAACRQEAMLSRYAEFQMKPGWARAFPVRTVGMHQDVALGQVLGRPGLTLLAAWSLDAAQERQVVSSLLGRIREEIASWPESRRLRALLVFEEAHRYLMDKDVEPLLETLARTARARGVGLVFVSQNCVDLPPVVRNNAATRIQMQTGYGPDLTRAAQVFGTEQAKRIPSLKQGQGALNYPEFGTAFLAFRPLLHELHAVEEQLPGDQALGEAAHLVAPAVAEPNVVRSEGVDTRGPSVTRDAGGRAGDRDPEASWREAAKQVATRGMTSRSLAAALLRSGVEPPSERTLRRFLHELRTSAL